MKNKIESLGISSTEAEELIRVSKDIEKDYQLLLKKYPIQYLIGYVNFYGYKINVNESVLIPRYETEFLVEKTLGYAKKLFNSNIDVLDLCTGSGCIAISIAKNISSSVSASDISESALELAKNNAKINDVNINFIKSNILDNINDKYDLIISNPPYISHDEEVMDSVKLYEPHLALYADDNGLYFYDKILKNINKNLKSKYIIAFEIGYKQAGDIKKLVNKYLGDVKVIVEKDLSLKDRYLFIINE